MQAKRSDLEGAVESRLFNWAVGGHSRPHHSHFHSCAPTTRLGALKAMLLGLRSLYSDVAWFDPELVFELDAASDIAYRSYDLAPRLQCHTDLVV